MLKNETDVKIYHNLWKTVTLRFSTLILKFCCTEKEKNFSIIWHFTWWVEKNCIQIHVGKNEDKNYSTFTLIFTHWLIFNSHSTLTLIFWTHPISKVWNFMAKWFSIEELPSKVSKKSKKCQKCNVHFGLKLSFLYHPII